MSYQQYKLYDSITEIVQGASIVIFGLMLGCTYSLEELNQVQKIDRRAERTIQAGLKYSRDKLHSSNHFNLPLNGILDLEPEQASYLAEWDPHGYQTNYLYEQ